MRLSTAARAGEQLVPGACRKQYFALAVDRGTMFACLAGCAYLGSYPTPEDAEQERTRLARLLAFGDGKLHTASHGITKRLYAAYPDLGRNIKAFPALLKTGPLRVSAEERKTMSLFGYLTKMFDDSKKTVDECVAILERAGL